MADSLYLRFSVADKNDSHGLMFEALHSKNFELVPDLVEIGVPVTIKNEVGVAQLYIV